MKLYTQAEIQDIFNRAREVGQPLFSKEDSGDKAASQALCYLIGYFGKVLPLPYSWGDV